MISLPFKLSCKMVCTPLSFGVSASSGISHPIPSHPLASMHSQILIPDPPPFIIVSCLFTILQPYFSHLPRLQIPPFLPSLRDFPYRPVGSSTTGGGLNPHLTSSWWPRCALFILNITRQRTHVDVLPSHPLLLYPSTLPHVLPTNPLSHLSLPAGEAEITPPYAWQITRKGHCILLSALLRSQ